MGFGEAVSPFLELTVEPPSLEPLQGLVGRRYWVPALPSLFYNSSIQSLLKCYLTHYTSQHLSAPLSEPHFALNLDGSLSLKTSLPVSSFPKSLPIASGSCQLSDIPRCLQCNNTVCMAPEFCVRPAGPAPCPSCPSLPALPHLLSFLISLQFSTLAFLRLLRLQGFAYALPSSYNACPTPTLPWFDDFLFVFHVSA